MPEATWLADVLRAEGLHVIEMAGWKSRRTRAGFNPAGIVCHHTATGKNVSDVRTRALLRDGRADLTGPLSQLGLERDGTFVVVAAGRCNHNGFGTWGNDSIGIEAYNDGTGEPWPKPQMDAYRRGCAAICRHEGWGIASVRGHKETDPKRKIDPTFDMNRFRADLAPLIKTPTPKPVPPTVQQEDDMAAPPFTLHLDSRNGRVYRVDTNDCEKVWITGPNQQAATNALTISQTRLTAFGFGAGSPADYSVIAQANTAAWHNWLDSIKTIT